MTEWGSRFDSVHKAGEGKKNAILTYVWYESITGLHFPRITSSVYGMEEGSVGERELNCSTMFSGSTWNTLSGVCVF